MWDGWRTARWSMAWGEEEVSLPIYISLGACDSALEMPCTPPPQGVWIQPSPSGRSLWACRNYPGSVMKPQGAGVAVPSFPPGPLFLNQLGYLSQTRLPSFASNPRSQLSVGGARKSPFQRAFFWIHKYLGTIDLCT